jgi:CrcB protein
MIRDALLVGAGGAAGSVLRWLAGSLAAAELGSGFPWGTLAVNIIGCAAIGALAARAPVPEVVRLFVVTGLLGGFTTVSAFALETGVLAERSVPLSAAYVAGSVLGGLAAFFLVRRALG